MRSAEPLTALGEVLGCLLQQEPVRAALADVLGGGQATPHTPEQLLTRDGVCELLQISRSKLDTMIASDPEFPRLRVGSVDRFERDAVLAYFRNGQSAEERGAA